MAHNRVQVTLYEGTAKKSGEPYTAIKLEIGDWTKLVFTSSKFEMDYIKSVLSKKNQAPAVDDDADVFGGFLDD